MGRVRLRCACFFEDPRQMAKCVTPLLLLAPLLLASCVDGRGPRGSRGDAGELLDAGATFVPPPGTLSLAVEGAGWYGPSQLLVRVRVGNGAGSEPASLAPSFFAIALPGGAELTAAPAGAPTPEPCRAELAVAAGGSVACELLFESVTGSPSAIHYRPPERSATAALATCSVASPEGLCAPGQICDGGACVAACSFEQPRGACASGGELCVGGSCQPRCSPSAPDGPCEVGECRDGACDTSCRTVDLGGEGCFDCLLPLYEGTSPCGTAREECQACAECVVYGDSSCGCLESAECVGCEAEVVPLWDCVAATCPTCFY
jgi:hypothetical protein